MKQAFLKVIIFLLIIHFLWTAKKLIRGISPYIIHSSIDLSGKNYDEKMEYLLGRYYTNVKKLLKIIPKDENIVKCDGGIFRQQIRTGTLNYLLYPRKIFFISPAEKDYFLSNEKWLSERKICWMMDYINNRLYIKRLKRCYPGSN